MLVYQINYKSHKVGGPCREPRHGHHGSGAFLDLVKEESDPQAGAFMTIMTILSEMIPSGYDQHSHGSHGP